MTPIALRNMFFAILGIIILANIYLMAKRDLSFLVFFILLGVVAALILYNAAARKKR